MSRCARTPPARLPMMPQSTWVRCVIGIAYVTPGAGTPTCTHTPPHSRHMTACSVTAGWPTHSNDQLTPPAPNGPSGISGEKGSNSLIASTGFASAALMKCVAPSWSASSPFAGMVSTAMMWFAALMRRAWMVERPTPPAPKTATLSPGWTLARLNTDPMPVTTPQAIRHAEVSGTSLSIGTACTSFTTVSSANDDVAAKLPAGSPPTVKISRRLPRVLRHQVGLPTEHWSQMPQLETVAMTTWSPGFTRVTSDPTASTTPAPSWPMSDGAGHGMVPSRRLTSLWQTPAATSRTSTSSGPGSITVTSSRTSAPSPLNTIPRMGRTLSRAPKIRGCVARTAHGCCSDATSWGSASEGHEAAAVDHEGLAGHVAGEVAGEEDRDGADVGFGVADATQRGAPDEQAVGEHGAGLGDGLHRRRHGDGADAVHPYACRPPLASKA